MTEHGLGRRVVFEGIDFGKVFSNRPEDPYHQEPLTGSRITEAEKVFRNMSYTTRINGDKYLWK